MADFKDKISHKSLRAMQIQDFVTKLIFNRLTF